MLYMPALVTHHPTDPSRRDTASTTRTNSLRLSAGPPNSRGNHSEKKPRSRSCSTSAGGNRRSCSILSRMPAMVGPRSPAASIRRVDSPFLLIRVAPLLPDADHERSAAEVTLPLNCGGAIIWRTRMEDLVRRLAPNGERRDAPLPEFRTSATLSEDRYLSSLAVAHVRCETGGCWGRF